MILSYLTCVVPVVWCFRPYHDDKEEPADKKLSYSRRVAMRSVKHASQRQNVFPRTGSTNGRRAWFVACILDPAITVARAFLPGARATKVRSDRSSSMLRLLHKTQNFRVSWTRSGLSPKRGGSDFEAGLLLRRTCPHFSCENSSTWNAYNKSRFNAQKRKSVAWAKCGIIHTWAQMWQRQTRLPRKRYQRTQVQVWWLRASTLNNPLCVMHWHDVRIVHAKVPANIVRLNAELG